MEDLKFRQIFNYLESRIIPNVFSSTKYNFLQECSKYKVENKNLIRDGRIVLKKSELNKVFKEFHQHSGRDPCWSRIKARFYWVGGKEYIARKTKNCVHCLNKHNPNWPAYMAPLRPIAITPTLFWKLHVDLLGPLPTTSSGNKYIALGVCAFSKYIECEGILKHFFFPFVQ